MEGLDALYRAWLVLASLGGVEVAVVVGVAGLSALGYALMRCVDGVVDRYLGEE